MKSGLICKNCGEDVVTHQNGKCLIDPWASDTEQKCAECGAYENHSPMCSKNTPEQIKKHLKTYFDAYQKTEQRIRDSESRAQRKINAADIERDLWKGKFYTLKHENNQLRKKLVKDAYEYETKSYQNNTEIDYLKEKLYTTEKWTNL